MKNLKPIILLLIVFLSAYSGFSQRKFGGKVVEIIDGKTAVIEMHTGRLIAVLQYIETPEANQPLYQTVRNHLSGLVLGKKVEFLPQRIVPGKTIGQMVAGGADVSRQMIRDGAAWLMPTSMSGQDRNEFSLYAEAESLARQEKRGVWSIDELKPAWVAREEAREKALRQETAAYQAIGISGAVESQTPGRPKMDPRLHKEPSGLEVWTDVFAGLGRESTGLQTFNEPGGKFSTVYTSNAFVNLSADGKNQKLEFRAMYVTLNLPDGSEQNIYVLGFQAISNDFNFSRRKSRLTILADKQRISLGIARGFWGQASYGVHEVFYYKIIKQSLAKLANAKHVEVRIDGYSGTVGEEAKQLIKQLVTTMD